MGTALLLIDVINAFDFEGAGGLIRSARKAAKAIESLSQRARDARVPIVYVNDNFGQWRSDFQSTVRECTRPDRPGHAISERLRPRDGDYFVLKPQHSGFYATPLQLLLDHLHVQTLVLTGFAANICVLFTANDAHIRGYQIVVPRDCVASNTASLNRNALRHIEVALAGSTTLSTQIDFRALGRKRRKPRGQGLH